MTAIKKPYDPVPRVIHDIGSMVEDDIRKKRDSNGNCYYEKVGEKKIDEYIGSFAPGCSLQSMLERCALMPTSEKIGYFMQTEEGVSADLSDMPTDGTAARIMLNKSKLESPDIYARVSNGEKLDDVIKSMIENKPEKENNENGSNESSND